MGKIRVRSNTSKNALAGSPGAFNRLRLHALDQIGIDPLGRPPQGELAQCGQILWFKEVLYSARRCILHIDLALGEALEQFVGRKIDQYNLVSLIEDGIGYGLTYAHLGDLLHDVV